MAGQRWKQKLFLTTKLLYYILDVMNRRQNLNLQTAKWTKRIIISEMDFLIDWKLVSIDYQCFYVFLSRNSNVFLHFEREKKELVISGIIYKLQLLNKVVSIYIFFFLRDHKKDLCCKSEITFVWILIWHFP